MEILIGAIIGIIATAIIGAIASYFFLGYKQKPLACGQVWLLDGVGPVELLTVTSDMVVDIKDGVETTRLGQVSYRTQTGKDFTMLRKDFEAAISKLVPTEISLLRDKS